MWEVNLSCFGLSPVRPGRFGPGSMARFPGESRRRVGKICNLHPRWRIALGFYESLKNIYSSKTSMVKMLKQLGVRHNSYRMPRKHFHLQCFAKAAFLRHCRINFSYDAPKIVPMGHLTHNNFRPVAGFYIGKLR